MKIFKGENILEFATHFPDDLSCKEYLSKLKWEDGYTCRKCGHTKHTQRTDFTKTCTFCHHNESATAHTAFHKVKFGLRKAFFITFEMVNTTKSLSASQVAKRYGINRNTAWLFMHKVRKAMASSENYPMEGDVQIDEFTIGGKEKDKPGRSYDTKKKKIVGAVELSENGGIKRVYALKIDNYSSKSLEKIFKKHISKDARVRTDNWKGYRPIMRDYNISQSKSNNGASMPEMHIAIHLIKSWLRTVYSWVHAEHVEKYLDEFCFRINRSIYKETIFAKIIGRMVKSEHIAYKQIIVASK